MILRFKKIKAKIRLTIFCLFIWTVLALAGCGGVGDIPVASVLTSGRITLSWNEIPGAASFEIYLATSPGVTTLNSYKIPDVTPPITITDLEPGTTYYFMVAVYSDSGESRNSKEVSYTVDDAEEGFIEFGDLISQSKAETKSVPPSEDQVPAAADQPDVAEKTTLSAVAAAPQKAASQIIICFGDSLTAGIGAGSGMDYPAQLAKLIGKPVINRGISGDTTATALRRLNRDVLSAKPDVVLITLGGNDLKNGIAKKNVFNNLKYIVETIQKQGARVIIGGLKFPGRDQGFGQGYEDLAQQTGATLIPNIFDGIIDNPKLMSDPIHPNADGYGIIARRFYTALRSPEKMSQSVSKKSAPATTKKPVPTATQKSPPGAIKKTVPTASQKSKQASPSNATDTRDVTLAWDDVPGATSYNIYWSDKPGVNRRNGTKISNVKNPHKLNDLMKGEKYYFVVTAVNQSGESSESAEFSFTVGE